MLNHSIPMGKFITKINIWDPFPEPMQSSHSQNMVGVEVGSWKYFEVTKVKHCSWGGGREGRDWGVQGGALRRLKDHKRGTPLEGEALKSVSAP